MGGFEGGWWGGGGGLPPEVGQHQGPQEHDGDGYGEVEAVGEGLAGGVDLDDDGLVLGGVGGHLQEVWEPLVLQEVRGHLVQQGGVWGTWSVQEEGRGARGRGQGVSWMGRGAR